MNLTHRSTELPFIPSLLNHQTHPNIKKISMGTSPALRAKLHRLTGRTLCVYGGVCVCAIASSFHCQILGRNQAFLSPSLCLGTVVVFIAWLVWVPCLMLWHGILPGPEPGWKWWISAYGNMHWCAAWVCYSPSPFCNLFVVSTKLQPADPLKTRGVLRFSTFTKQMNWTNSLKKLWTDLWTSLRRKWISRMR